MQALFRYLSKAALIVLSDLVIGRIRMKYLTSGTTTSNASVKNEETKNELETHNGLIDKGNSIAIKNWRKYISFRFAILPKFWSFAQFASFNSYKMLNLFGAIVVNDKNGVRKNDEKLFRATLNCAHRFRKTFPLHEQWAGSRHSYEWETKMSHRFYDMTHTNRLLSD